MFERFTSQARAMVMQAQEHARRLGHNYIGCEHLLLAAAGGGEPAGAALRESGVTPEAVEQEIRRLIGAGQAASLLSGLDREALASIGIDLDAVRARIEATFGPGALERDIPCRSRGRWRSRNRLRLGSRSRNRLRLGHHRPDRAAPATYGRPVRAGHIPFTPRAKKSLELSLREAKALGDNYLGAQHVTLALLAMNSGAVPPILAALGARPAVIRTAILNRYRQAS